MTGYGIAGVTIAAAVFICWLVSLANLIAHRPDRPPLVADPADRRVAQVADAYAAGEFGPDELDWRILLALVPPPPDRDGRARMWGLAQRAAMERMQQPVLGGGDGAIVAFPSHSTPWTAAVPSTESVPWSAAPQPDHVYVRNQDGGPLCNYRELRSGSGYLTTVCDCGHDMNQHYNGGCNDCDVAHRMAPPKPEDAARSVRPRAAYVRRTRQSHG